MIRVSICNLLPLCLMLGMIPCLNSMTTPAKSETHYAEIRVVDESTGRGVPLVELETVNSVKFVTDNAGRVAFHEPGLLGKEVFFTVRSHGYELPKDGFGFRGTRLTPQIGKVAEIKLPRKNLAERLCRLTGEGRSRDSLLLGHKIPKADEANQGRVVGQDSIQAAIYRKRVYWFWGDTLRIEYPLGLFRMAGATTAIPDPKDTEFDLSQGLPYEYFLDRTGFAKAMMPLPERPEGVIWIESIFTLPNDKGVEQLLGHYSRRKGLEGEFEQGIAVFDDDKQIFRVLKPLPLAETWRRPTGHPNFHEHEGTRWLLFGHSTPNARVPARLADVLDPAKYEAWSCAKAKSKGEEPDLDGDGKPRWRWQKELPPTDSQTEAKWIKQGKIKPEVARLCPANHADAKERVTLHRGTVRWNEYRKRWVLIAGQIGGKSSLLGEIWYSECEHPTGPFAKAVRIVTHDRQTFYNVCHHPFLDRDGGRFIHFEGTYTNEFSGNPDKTPRYNYNQILYRLDLSLGALKTIRE
jgi:hypothetical protein